MLKSHQDKNVETRKVIMKRFELHESLGLWGEGGG